MHDHLLAKLQSPVASNAVIRQRLFHMIDQARIKKGVWVTGLPGSGKTTLVASYLYSQNIPHAWYHMDSSDVDLATLFYYLRYVVKNLTPSRHARLPHLKPEYLANITVYARRYFENLYSMLPRGGVLVFDNYHEVSGNPVVHTIMREALMTLPEQGSVIFISRTQPPSELLEPKTNNRMIIVDQESMKFTPDETHEFVRLRLGDRYDPDSAQRLHTRTDGWAAGIVLMLEQEVHGVPVPAQDGLNDYQAIFDYFSAEIFERLEPRTQEFLMQTCFFPSMTVEMADRMTDSSASGRMLNRLAEAQYFTARHRNNTYTYHDLFRNFLIARVSSTQSPAYLSEVRKRAAEILEHEGYLEEAVTLFIANKAWTDAIALILHQAQCLIVHYDKASELDHISATLWPDAPGDYAHQTLDSTIHRLRKLLGAGDAVLAEAGRLMLNPKVCWVDVQALIVLGDSLEALLQRAPGKRAERQANIRVLGNRIIDLYKGDFFAQSYLPPWAMGFREILRDRFAGIIELLGAYEEDAGEREQAVVVYKKGLAMDESRELFYQRLMLLYQSMGKYDDAVALYQRCSATLSQTLGIQPSDKTRKLFERISHCKGRGR